MVRKLEIKTAIKRIPSVLILSGVAQFSLAGGFYTIIGPDGFPMVVPQGIHEKKPAKKTQSDQVKTQKVAEPQKQIDPVAQPSNAVPKAVAPPKAEATTTLLPPPAAKPPKNEAPMPTSVPKVAIVSEKAKNPSKNLPEKAQQAVKKQTSVAQDLPENNLNQLQTVQPSNSIQKPAQNTAPVVKSVVKPTVQNQAPSTAPALQTQQKTIVQDDNSPKNDGNFSKIDGVEYVNNEFLENREFNLEGRKRFYITPDSNVMGTGHVETVERQKGITKAVLQKFMNPDAEQAPLAIALASTYYRLPKEQVVESLDQSCFSGKKFKKPKELSQKNSQLGIWPVPPIKERFVYEIVKINADVENIQFTSYATTSKNPTFYWPLAVFLDQNGCVVEGVSGFKNEETAETTKQHAALAGILKKPAQAQYLFLTPLSEAVDVEGKQLTNQGQIKLGALR